MTGDSDSEIEASTHRRRFLKLAGTAGVSAAAFSSKAAADTKEIGVYYAPNDAFAATGYREEAYYYSISADDWYRIDFTVEGLGGYSKSNGTWGTTFRNHAYGVLRRYDPSYSSPADDPNSKRLNNIEGHRIGYYDKDDGNQSTFGYKYSEGKLGGWPTPQYTALEIAEDVVQELSKVALAEINDAANIILTTDQIYNNVSAQIDEETSNTSGENQTFEWPYGGSFFSDTQSDVSHVSEIDYEQEYDCVSTFYAQSGMYEGQIEPAVNWKVEVESPTSSSSTSKLSASRQDSTPTPENPEPNFSPETIKRFGLRKVPIKDLRARGIDLVDPLVLEGNKTWWATDLQGDISILTEDQTPF